MSDEDHRETEYGMVMPFLPVRSKGGPHNDDAFVAGYEMGLLDAELEAAHYSVYEKTIHEGNAAQADLIAMRRGFIAEFGEPQGGWVSMSLRVSQEVL